MLIPSPWQAKIHEWCSCNYRNAWTVKEYCSLFIGTGHSLWGITIMPFIKVYNNDSDPCRLKGHSIFKSVQPFIFGYVIILKLHEWYLRRHVRAASATAVPFCRTFSDEACSQQHCSVSRACHVSCPLGFGVVDHWSPLSCSCTGQSSVFWLPALTSDHAMFTFAVDRCA
jgi:hypothetical protein